MPNRDVHAPVAWAAGTVSAGVAARSEQPEVIVLRMLGGFLGGHIGGKMPDIFDPPRNGPNHRSVGHGVVPVASVIASGRKRLLEARNWLKDKAGEFSDSGNQIMSGLCQICIGIIDGIIAGYISHLALDATTPKGLPLIA